MKKQLKLLLLLLLVAGATAVKAQTVILEESLINKFTSGEKLATNPDGYEGWVFENCWSVYYVKQGTDERTYFIQVGYGTNNHGSITTPSFTGLTGNARITFDVLAADVEQTIEVSIINDNNEEIVGSYTPTVKDRWYSQSLLLKNLNENTRIKFSCDTDKFKFQVRNIVVTDIGECLYMETFRNVNSFGGNDDNFASGNIQNRKTSEVASFDNPLSTIDDKGGVKDAKQSIIFFIENSTYSTAPIYTNSTRANVVLSFRLAGDNSISKIQKMYVSYSKNGKTITTPETFTGTAGEWEVKSTVIRNFDLNKVVTFNGQDFFLDDVTILPLFDVTIDEQADNAPLLQKRSNNYVNATLQRTLTAGIWNTLCLPFAVSNTMISNSATIRQLTSVSNGVYNFKTVNNVPAGEPFLVKVNETVTNPTFTDVVIEAPTPTTKTFGNYGFAGVYSPTQLNVDGTHLFLGTDGYLYAPSDANSNTINGMRAYFVLPSGNARVAFVEDEEAAGITEHNREQIMSDGCYNLIGQPVSSPARGLYIVDGKKTLMK